MVRTLNAVSPLATLDRGYAIVSRVSGAIVRSAAELSPGTPIEVRLARRENPRQSGGILIRRARIRPARIRRARIRCAALLLCASPTLAFSYALPHESAVPGGVKILKLDVHGDSMPYVDVDGHRALVVQDGSSWIAIIGIPLSASLAPRQVIVRSGDARQEVQFSIGDKQYASQSLKVAPGQVNLSQADLERVNREKLIIEHAMSRWSDEQPETLRMPQPIPGVRSSSFGMRRIFNGESRNPHGGMDIAAPVGTPVHGAASRHRDRHRQLFFQRQYGLCGSRPRHDQHVLPLERDRRETRTARGRGNHAGQGGHDRPGDRAPFALGLEPQSRLGRSGIVRRELASALAVNPSPRSTFDPRRLPRSRATMRPDAGARCVLGPPHPKAAFRSVLGKTRLR